MKLSDLNKDKRIHFVGVGGVSMSALAEIMISKGYKVSGSDINYCENIKKLENAGMKFIKGHYAENVTDAAAVVYTAAVHADNPEIAEARRLKLPLIRRSQLLGAIMAEYKISAAIAGTHGKTTVTSMLSYILEKNGFDPTILVGAELDIIGGNLKIGKSDYFVAEACEYQRSFLDFKPYCAAILNAEPDHMDYYKDADDYHSAFAEFITGISDDGFLVINGADDDLKKLAEKAKCRVYTFGMGSGFDFEIKNITADEGGTEYDLMCKKGSCRVKLGVYGKHNVLNSAAALANAVLLGAEPQKAADALKSFHGADRRMEFKGRVNGAAVYDDYAHHPTEMAATLDAVSDMKHGRVICVFQPHTYSRTKAFFKEFAAAFKDIDEAVYTDIYAAREKDDGSVNSEMLAKSARGMGINARYIGKFEDIAEYIKDTAKSGDIVIIMGAGDIVKLTGMITE